MAGISDDPVAGLPRLQPRRHDLTVAAACTVPIAEICLGPFPRGAVLIVCDADTFMDVDGQMNALAEHGYESLAVGIPPGPPAQDDATVDVLLRRLGEWHWELEQIGILGYGVAAQSALRAAGRYALGAAVTVVDLGAADQREQACHAMAALLTPWLGLTCVSPAGPERGALERLAQNWATQAPVYTDVIGYTDLPRQFYHDIEDALSHAAAFDSWQRTVEWLNNHVMPRLTPATLAWRSRLPANCGMP
ncbi:hypothetical protein BayCH28_22690 [Mycolicibacterium sp. CH28]|uniref:hypothetical protein n=1 Tax=Mycolicibacterium sp. CH28 TaxID=2512237 RepID=UPI00107FF654|nr:hypothetical protein [Mycolicibacterium sp. CH28]TGD85201.1 hypothetical protein BayCH28_22690 [Mycolicibacterium sp. CH28]